MNRLHRLARLCGEEGEQVDRLDSGLDLPDAGPRRGIHARKEAERVIARECEPDRPVAVLGIAAGLAEGREGDETAARGRQPRLPVRAGGIPDVGRAGVGFQLQQLREIDVLAFRPQLVRPLRCSVELSLLRRRQAPPRQGQDPLTGFIIPDDRCRVVRINVARFEVADVAAHRTCEVQDRGRALPEGIQVADRSALRFVTAMGPSPYDRNSLHLSVTSDQVEHDRLIDSAGSPSRARPPEPLEPPQNLRHVLNPGVILPLPTSSPEISVRGASDRHGRQR